MSRSVSLVLVDPAGTLLGALPPVQVPSPWWQEVAEIAPAAGLDLQILRLLHGDQSAPPGGHVTYLAQVAPPAGLTLGTVEVDLTPHPHRAAYAEPGGPAASIAWAVESLAALGTPGATVRQQRTWNLSAIWRLDAAGAPVAWLKQVPSFFAHEPAALGLVGGVVPGLVPPLLAAGAEGRMLLAHVPGADRYGAGADICRQIAAAFHPVQAHFAGRTEELTAAGVPDGRLDLARYRRVAEPFLDEIDGLRDLLDDLPRRFAEVAGCGLPDTLVHGDLHPGNTRTDDAGHLSIMDWGDCTVGHPAFDILRLTDGLDDPGTVLTEWEGRWRETVPGSDPLRVAELLRPVAGLRGAAVYAGFLAAVEPAEWPYHAADVPACLTEAVTAARR
ncbi:phosphotransferase family protein [Micromonosporaceae bacterium Da 78-11]